MDEDNILRLEFQAISDMTRIASKYGLLTEVLYTYTAEIRAGKDIQQAAADALSEWDI